MKNYFIICLMLMFGKQAFSQNDTIKFIKNSIGIQIGYNQGLIKDLNFSPLNYKESGLLYAFNYTRQNPNKKGIINVGVEFSSANLKTRASEYLASSLIMANIEVSYVRKVTKKEKVHFYLGGQYNTYIHILDWQDLESFSYIASHGVGLKGFLSYDLTSKHRFSSALFIPVFQFLARPPYNGIDEEIIENQDNAGKLIFSGKATSFNRYIAFDWDFNYLFALSKRFDLAVKYSLRYQNLSEINKVIHLQNQLSIGANVKF